MDPDVIAAIIHEIVELEVMPRYRTLRTEEIKEKTGPLDLVTAADMAVEEGLTRRLLDLDHKSIVVGEEAAGGNPHLLERLAEDKLVWIVDPIDGTFNFAHGQPGFVTIVAAVQHGDTIAGWIYDPLAAMMITAVRQSGAWWGSRRLNVPSGVTLSSMSGSAYGQISTKASVAACLAEVCNIADVSNLYCSGLEYTGIALGHRHFLVSEKSLPWDHAAGTLIVQEAGGKVAFLDGSAYDPRIPNSRILVAPEDGAWKSLQAALRVRLTADTAAISSRPRS